jgi:predicted nucleotidyltransferase component of viral defense system
MRTLTSEQAEMIRDVIDAKLTTMPESALEKDIHLTEVLHALTRLPLELNLVFCGGTSLSKCFQAISRMSEDADFKFHLREAHSKTAARSARSKLKHLIREQIAKSGFDVSIKQEENDNSFFSFTVGYESKFEKVSSLRETILLEFTHVDSPPATITKPISEIVNVLQGLYMDLGQIECLTIEQTMAEKALSFVRRAPDFSQPNFDSRIVRHLYDLRAISRIEEVNFSLVGNHFDEAFSFDKSRYGFSEAKARSNLETLRGSKETFQPLFESFVRELTTDNSNEFDECWGAFISLAEQLLSNHE